MGYHIDIIKKGVLGHPSKIQEELDELLEARKQGVRILEMVELSDLYGALEAVAKHYDLTMEDLRRMSDCTKRAFASGRRK